MWTQTNLSKEKRFLGRVMATPQDRRNSGPLALRGEGKSQRGWRACLQGAADVGLSVPTGRRLLCVSTQDSYFPLELRASQSRREAVLQRMGILTGGMVARGRAERAW